MRPIDNTHLVRVANIAALNASNAAIGGVAQADRGAFIDAHEPQCSAIRNGLWAVGCMKCWYSEAQLQEGEGQVEHYRPKKRVSGAAHSGYWWRAFDWRNLRLAHPTVNLRRTEFLTKRKVGKGSYFPLRDPANRATNLAGEAHEQPLLLDPIVPADTRLICFDETSGAPRPRYEREQDSWLHERADKSIDYYHLDEGTWNKERADLMAEVRELCNQLEALAIAQPRDENAYHQKIDQIVAYINPFAKFSSACIQVVRDKDLLEHFASGL
jgi:hypothetical protein